ncbi:MAG: hypothetical protein WAW92_01120 [Minisyncoccia bacterium]
MKVRDFLIKRLDFLKVPNSIIGGDIMVNDRPMSLQDYLNLCHGDRCRLVGIQKVYNKDKSFNQNLKDKKFADFVIESLIRN